MVSGAILKIITIVFLLFLTISFDYTLAMIENSERKGTHTFGERIANDRLLYRVENPFGNAGFFYIKFGSPETAGGPDINCVKIAVNDIFNETHAYISSGGIDEKFIVVVLGVLHKTEFSFEASVYGLERTYT